MASLLGRMTELRVSGYHPEGGLEKATSSGTLVWLALHARESGNPDIPRGYGLPLQFIQHTVSAALFPMQLTDHLVHFKNGQQDSESNK